MDINLSFTIPMWLVYSYPVFGFMVALGLSVWGRYQLSSAGNRVSWKRYFSKGRIFTFLITVLVWPFALFITIKDEVTSKRAIKNYKSQRDREKELEYS